MKTLFLVLLAGFLLAEESFVDRQAKVALAKAYVAQELSKLEPWITGFPTLQGNTQRALSETKDPEQLARLSGILQKRRASLAIKTAQYEAWRQSLALIEAAEAKLLEEALAPYKVNVPAEKPE